MTRAARHHVPRTAAAILAIVLATAAPDAALAWGATGHRIVGEEAIAALPRDLPAFLRNPRAAADVGELAREPDRSKGAGKTHDSNLDPAHYIDLDDAGKAFGGPSLRALPPTRAEYEAALQAVGQDSWKAGYLPYSIVEQHQQLVVDFAYWRVLDAAERNHAWRGHQAWFRDDRRRREALIFETLGQLAHFVGDGAQPLHATLHYNGWGDFPNPKGFTTAKVHSPVEGAFVRASVRSAEVRARMAPYRPCACAIDERTRNYLAATHALVEPFYSLEKQGGFQRGDPRGAAFVTRELARGASELRDMVADAWRASATAKVGWPAVAVADVVNGKTDPYTSLYGLD
ncbi:S1/P1 Nuclease [Phenylobacterium sp.]|uniref:S1/P1 Nuclease n=1 Tax=Phenylobacterium sp. TaxID=1871053 RepID=UPI0027328C90|nr:S1/P1 Nuclease [Phenylobacterium sp.]MDP3661085.1 S1/P1 Nuclease [Phenylobacterium sp.]